MESSKRPLANRETNGGLRMRLRTRHVHPDRPFEPRTGRVVIVQRLNLRGLRVRWRLKMSGQPRGLEWRNLWFSGSVRS
jgi:hypothetical protein